MMTPGSTVRSAPISRSTAGFMGPPESRGRRNHRGTGRVGPGMASGHTITITPAELHVEVSLAGQKLAESDRPVLLDETGLPTRYYLPQEDERTALLQPTDTAPPCPSKGAAPYGSDQSGDET